MPDSPSRATGNATDGGAPQNGALPQRYQKTPLRRCRIDTIAPDGTHPQQQSWKTRRTDATRPGGIINIFIDMKRMLV
ncbi:MAG: hypothetical protein LBF61_10920 [Azoarcus sp.]|jgi:hypothetical protein|nr:hypothetical protein [Azoarcus sp.]